jgi:cell division protein FtsQ
VNKWKHIWAILKWLLLLAYLLVMLSFVKRERKAVRCSQVSYDISRNHAFVDTAEVYDVLIKDSVYPVGKPMAAIDLKKIEELVTAHPAIKKTDVFSEMDGKLYISVQQRNPLLRIITESNMHYYVDDDYGLMSVGFDYTADVPVLSGHLPDTLISAFRQGNDSLQLPQYAFTMNELIDFAGYLYEDPLWRNLIVQVYVNDQHEFELIPRLGDYLIILGNLENYPYKMKKLEAVYKKAFPDFGWKDYKTINLKYSNQVVCSK